MLTREQVRAHVAGMLATGHNLRIVVDAIQCNGLPAELTGAVHLDIGYNMVCPIPDLLVGPNGISATLRFPSGLSTVDVPWDALLAAVYLEPQFPKPAGASATKRSLPAGWAVHKGGKA